MRILAVLIIALLLASQALAADTRGLTVVARDPATNQSGEVRLYNKTYAVIIGIDRYQNLPPDRQLQNAVKDALGVEEVLKKHYQFDKIVTLRDEEATRDRIMRLLTRELPKEMGKDDALFLFWSGHGNQEKTDDGELGYLIPFDGNGDGIYGNITMSQLRDDISKALPAKHIFYAFDACYSGLLTTRAVDGKSRRDLTYLKEITKERVRQVLTAGGKGEEALDGGPKGHSVFTGRLIEILENAGDFITANELQAAIRERVYSDARARNHTQTPGFGPLYGLGDFVFVPKETDKLGNLAGASLARQKELDALRKAEQEAAAAKQKEQVEIARKQAELDVLDKQIAEMKGRLGTSAARSDDSLDNIVAMVEQKEAQAKRLEELRQQREAEERKRQQEIERLKRAALAKRVAQLKADIAKYQKVAQSKYGQDMKGTAWDALVTTYPEGKSAPRFDVAALLGAFGLVIDNGELVTPEEKQQREARKSQAGDFVAVSGGCFQMGDTFGDGQQWEKPVHEACVSDFAIAKYDVTVGQFREFILDTGYRTDAEKGDGCFVFTGKWEKKADANWRSPGFEQGNSNPVTCVSWNDATAYAQWRSRRDGKQYRLPTEAEWEYACRSGGKSEKYCGGDNVDAVAWYSGNSGNKTHPVGQKSANGLGLYDMSGNVWQWVSDWYSNYNSEKQQDPTGPSSGSYRVGRGGSWYDSAGHVRAAGRDYGDPGDRFYFLGFRLAAPVQ